MLSRLTSRIGLRIAGMTMVVMLALGTAAAASSSTKRASIANDSSTLTIASATGPVSLDPAKNGQGFPIQYFTQLAYDPLIRTTATGGYAPNLAIKWGYVGTGNRVFTLTLRPGVRFSDGTHLTAAGVKAYFNYYIHAGGPFASRFASIKTMTVTGPLSLRFNLKKPDPDLAINMSQDYVSGSVISRAAMKNPSRLGTHTVGAGPYVLDAGQTVAGTKYVYTPNKYYWNKSAIHFKKVQILVISDPSQTLAAMRSGQVDFALGNSNTAEAASSAGLQVLTTPGLWASVMLWDRAGTVVKPLGDVRVRQALNYAVDRATLAKAVLGKFGAPLGQPIVPGYPGYDKSLDNLFPYDQGKAKSLLAAAGYPDGFTLPMLVYNIQPAEDVFAQALASQLQAVGVNVQIKQEATIGEYANDTLSKKWAATFFEFDGQPISAQSSQLLYPGSGILNPLGSSDPDILKQLDQLSRLSGAAYLQKAKVVNKVIVQKAWFLPLASVDEIIYARPELKGVILKPGEQAPWPLDWHK